MTEEEKKLWILYKKTNRKELLEKIVEKYLYLVKIQANKLVIFASRSLDKNELYSAGIIGLLEAIERFDPEQNIEFSSYSNRRIRGSIIDEIRKTDWVPRSIRQKAKKINSAVNKFISKNGFIPSDEEVAKEMEITLTEYYNITDNLGAMHLSSLDSVITPQLNEEGLKVEDIVRDDSIENQELEYIKEKLKENIAKAIGRLPDKEKLVISLYYYEELNLKEIGMVLDVSESRVCQIHSSALLKLKNLIKNINLEILV